MRNHWHCKTSHRFQRWARRAQCACAGLALGGCSVSFPGPSLLSNDDTTASISKPVVLAPGLDEEDQRRASAAMGAALGPAGNGLAVTWDNPASGAHGTFTPVAAAYPRARLTCRAFLADVGIGAKAVRSLQGTACWLKDANWFIRDVKPWAG